MKRAAGAGLLAVAVAAGVVSGVTVAHDRASMTSYSGPPLPARFTAADGAAYRQLAVTYLTGQDQSSAALTFTAGSAPVDLMGSCDAPGNNILMGVKVNGKFVSIIACQDPPQLIGLPVRPGEKVRITFVGEARLGLPSRPGLRTGWQFAAYTWQPPVTARSAPAEPRLPPSYSGPNTTAGHGNAVRKLIASQSGTWPRDRIARFTLIYHDGHSLDISEVCAGPIGGRLQVSIQFDGSQGPTGSCTPAGPDQLTQGGSTTGGRNGKPLTLTFRIQAPSSYFAADYAKRAASWTIAIYEEQ